MEKNSEAMQFGKHTYIYNLIDYFSLAHGTAQMQLHTLKINTRACK